MSIKSKLVHNVTALISLQNFDNSLNMKPWIYMKTYDAVYFSALHVLPGDNTGFVKY